MAANCPWCQQALKKSFVRDLTSVSQPCPLCAKPLKQSLGHVAATGVMLLPLVGVCLYLAKMLYDVGTPFGAIFVLFVGLIFGGWVQRFLPVFSSPGRGFPIGRRDGRRDTQSKE